MKIVDIAGNAELNLALRGKLNLRGYVVSEHGLISFYRNLLSYILLHLNDGGVVIVKENLREFHATVRVIRNAIDRWK